MKKYLNYLFILFAIVGVFALTGCGGKDKKDINFEGTYTSDDSSELKITKENDKYKADISLFRLAQIVGCTSKDIKDAVLTISCSEDGEAPIKFTFDYDTKKLTVIESAWEIINVGDTFEFNK